MLILPLNPPKMSTQRRHSSRSPFNEPFPDWLLESVIQHHPVRRLVKVSVNLKEGGDLLLKILQWVYFFSLGLVVQDPFMYIYIYIYRQYYYQV